MVHTVCPLWNMCSHNDISEIKYVIIFLATCITRWLCCTWMMMDVSHCRYYVTISTDFPLVCNTCRKTSRCRARRKIVSPGTAFRNPVTFPIASAVRGNWKATGTRARARARESPNFVVWKILECCMMYRTGLKKIRY